jgi:hypothetical protein
MIEGAQQHGVNPEYIEQLKQLEKQPRKKPDEFMKIQMPDGLPQWTIADV